MASSQLRRYSPLPFLATGSPTARLSATGSRRDRLRASWAAAIAFAVTIHAVSAQETPPPTAIEAPAADTSALIEQLDADGYDERERAMTRLAEAGAAAIDPLTERLPGGSREMITRGMYVLSRLSLSQDQDTADRARGTLEAFAADVDSPLGRQAELALDDLNARILAQTVARLRDLGATVDMQVVSDAGIIRETVSLLSIDKAWRGSPKDLELVRRLGGATEVRLDGDRFDDAAVAIVADLEDMQTLTLKKIKLTKEGLAKLERLESLSTLKIYYCSGDAAVEPLEKLKSLAVLQLYGTNLSDEGIARLEKTFGPKGQGRLDIRNGAFLGVRGASIQEGALVTDVVEGSAAADAGMRPGDIIVTIDGKPVPDFEFVLTHVGEFRPGHEVAFGVVRGGEKFDRKVVLGEWNQ
jgi:hypothetical protein